MKKVITLVKEIIGTRLLAVAALCLACILVPAAAGAVDVDLQLVIAVDYISDLNPPVSNFDAVYEAGPVKSADGLTTFGSWTCVISRAGSASINYFDCVMALPPGNIYFKQVLNFSTGITQGIILGGDGPFFGITGTLVPVSGSTYRFSLVLP